MISDLGDFIGRQPILAGPEPSFPQSISSGCIALFVFGLGASTELGNEELVGVLPEGGVGDLILELGGERGGASVRCGRLLLRRIKLDVGSVESERGYTHV